MLGLNCECVFVSISTAKNEFSVRSIMEIVSQVGHYHEKSDF